MTLSGDGSTSEYLVSRSICAWCRQSSTPHGDSLKRCRGCEVAVYCGLECQAAAWSRHKFLCRGSLSRNLLDDSESEQSGMELTGYTTALGLGEELNEWIDLHKYSLTVIVHSALRRAGGAEANCRQGQVVTFMFAPTPPETDPNTAYQDPSMAFRVLFCKVMNAEIAPDVASQEAIPESARPAGEPEEIGFRGDPVNTTPAGFIPVFFAVDGTKIVLATRCAVYRACHHPDDAPVDEEMAAVFSDLQGVFIRFIHCGIVLRPPPDERAADPEAGNMFRVRKRWRWYREEYPSSWQMVDTMIALDCVPLQTALPAKTLWTRFQQW